jgi:hypothetical protein
MVLVLTRQRRRVYAYTIKVMYGLLFPIRLGILQCREHVELDSRKKNCVGVDEDHFYARACVLEDLDHGPEDIEDYRPGIEPDNLLFQMNSQFENFLVLYAKQRVNAFLYCVSTLLTFMVCEGFDRTLKCELSENSCRI